MSGVEVQPVKKGRGRPPKPKTEEVRGRGRPAKAEEAAGPSKVVVVGPSKVLVVPAPVATNKPARKRGRPAKAKEAKPEVVVAPGPVAVNKPAKKRGHPAKAKEAKAKPEVPATEESPSSLSVVALKARLAERGLARTGRKAELVARLLGAEPPEKKARARGAAKKAKDTVCVATCLPGPRSGCPTRGKGRPAGHLACAEVDRRLEALGVSADSASLCVKAAIMRGHIKIAGESKEELNQVVHSEVHTEGCGHTIQATLGDLLEQPDYAGVNYEEGHEEATVTCKEPECNPNDPNNDLLGWTYVTGLCEGRPTFDNGKYHNHCVACPGFGQCIRDYRNGHCDHCGRHYFASCDCRGGAEGFDDLGGNFDSFDGDSDSSDGDSDTEEED